MKFKDFVLIILIVFVVILAGYIAYDKVFNVEEDDSVIEDNNDNLLNNVTQIERYKNYDGSYASVETLFYDNFENPGEYYNISLDLLGNVNYFHRNGEEVKNVLLLKNVVDIVSFNDGAGNVEVSYCYMLDDSGDVYKFKITDNQEKVEKLEISNVSKLLYLSWGAKKDAGGSWAIVAVTTDDKYIEIASASV